MANDTFTADMLVPAYLERFQCVGPSCQDHCCHKWRVDIDKKGYHALLDMPDARLAAKARAALERNPRPKNDRHFATLKFTGPDDTCSFLDQGRLCAIHARFGETALPDVCHSYPRYTYSVQGEWRQAATLSCPEVARLCLLDPAGMDFRVRPVTLRAGTASVLQANAAGQGCGIDLHAFFINLLKERSYPFWQRLALIGLVCVEADSLIAEGRQAHIPALIEQMTAAIVSGACHDWLDPVVPDLANRFEIVAKLLAKRASGAAAAWYEKVFVAFCDGYQIEHPVDIERVALRYRAAWQVGMLPFMEQHPHFLENFALNHLFQTAFPIGAEQDMLEGFSELLIKYNMLMLLLTGMAASQGPHFGPEQALWAVQVLEKSYGHSQDYGGYAATVIKALSSQPAQIISLLLAEPRPL